MNENFADRLNALIEKEDDATTRDEMISALEGAIQTLREEQAHEEAAPAE